MHFNLMQNALVSLSFHVDEISYPLELKPLEFDDDNDVEYH